MSLIAKQNETNTEFELPPEGTHIARCYMVCDLGMQETEFNGEKKKKHKARVSFELCHEAMEDGRPFSVSKTYNITLHEKSALRKDLVSWRGKQFTEEELDGFDVFNVLGSACQVSIVHNKAENGKTYANIASITSMPKGTQAPELQNGIIKFSLKDYSQQAFNMLPEWLQGMINTDGIDDPYPGPQSENPAPSGLDDDIPF